MKKQEMKNQDNKNNQYLLSTYTVDGQVPGSPQTPEGWQDFMAKVSSLEAEMDKNDIFVFGGALLGANKTFVVAKSGVDIVHTTGPYDSSNKQLGGFYIINASNDEEALNWADKVAEATNHPIEVRPFRGTGRLVDQLI